MLPCLHGLLPEKYLQHLSLLVKAVYIGLKQSILPVEIKVMKLLYLTFNVMMQVHYGKKYMRLNYHLALHNADAIDNWSSRINCMPFEGENKQILEMQKSPTKFRLSDSVGEKIFFFDQRLFI